MASFSLQYLIPNHGFCFTFSIFHVLGFEHDVYMAGKCNLISASSPFSHSHIHTNSMCTSLTHIPYISLYTHLTRHTCLTHLSHTPYTHSPHVRIPLTHTLHTHLTYTIIYIAISMFIIVLYNIFPNFPIHIKDKRKDCTF